MSADFDFRKSSVNSLTRQIGVYVLCDLDEVPIYVGQSKDGIRQRVQRHLTSARSDIIANRQIDIWEVAYVWAFPVQSKEELDPLEAKLFHHFNDQSRLMNGTTPTRPSESSETPQATEKVQVATDHEIAQRKLPEYRLPRQAMHYAQLVEHFVGVKNSPQIAEAMDAHFERLERYHRMMIN